MAKKKSKKKTAGDTSPWATAAAASIEAPLDAAALQTATELQAQEMEVLQAIFDRDLVVKSSTPLYAHIFCIHVTQGAAEIVLHFDLGKTYPVAKPPNIEVENRHGLSDTEVTQLQQELGQLAKEKLGDVMVYDLVMHATEFVADHGKEQRSFFDQMIQRQHHEEEEKKRKEDLRLQQQEEEALARNNEILAMIDAERRKKMMVKKSHSLRRRRRRHRSSIDIRGDGDDQSGSYLSDDEAEDDGDAFDSFGEDKEEEEGEEQSGSELDGGRAKPVRGAWSGETAGEGRGEDDGDDTSSSSSSESDAIATEHAHSRYHTDFKEIGLLGRGGGGEVVKARNRLDRQLYAVKKIKLDPEDPTMKKKILREVKTISRMQHRHIVRYFQAWIEGVSANGSGSDSDSEDDESDFSDDSDADEESEEKQRWPVPPSSESNGGGSRDDDDSDESDVDDDDGDDDDDDEQHEDEDDWLGTLSSSVHMWSKNKDRGGATRKRSSSGFKSASSMYLSSTRHDDGFDWEDPSPFDEDDGVTHTPGAVGLRPPPTLRTRKLAEKLFIQMEFCEGNALREVIDKGGLWQDPNKIWTLFRQILEAIVYIHRQGIIHRDIKPPNIFLDAEGTVKLGDFGLAVRPQKTADVEEEENDEDDEANGGGATVGDAYVAQSNGSSAARLYERLKLENLESTRMVRDLTSVTTMSYDPGDHITAGVGTAFYRAPEQEREGERYNQKADMFSLGIVFFEMWSPPFTTLMERAQALTNLREKHQLPPSTTLPDNVQQIVIWLCHANPSLRPTASELLASPLLPAKMEVEGHYLREALETLANPRGKFFGQLIDALVGQEPESHIDYTFDHLETIKLKTWSAELRAKALVKRTLQKIFERHGSVEQTTPLLMPRLPELNYTGVALATPHSACALLDASGVAVTLPFDLTERLARFVARHNIARFKCHQFDRVYRKSLVGGGHPREFLEADFDIIWDDKAAFRFLEIEGLQVVSEVLTVLAPAVGSYYLRVNDARISKGILEMCSLPASARRELLKLLSNEVSAHVHAGVPSRMAPTLKPGRWKFVKKKLLEHGVHDGDESLDACRPFFCLPADGLATVDILETELSKLYTKRVAAARASTTKKKKAEGTLRRAWKETQDGLAALRLLLQTIDTLQLRGPICTRVDIGLSPRPERYTSGFIFQAVLTGRRQGAGSWYASSTASSATNLVIAEGGRYDQLLTRFKLPAAYVKASHVAAMGVRFSVDKIVSWVLASSTTTSTMGTTKGTTLADLTAASCASSTARPVLVCSAGKASDTLLLRAQVALLLWSHGIGADFLHPDPLHLEDLEDYCAQQRIPLMVIVQSHLMREKNQVKVRAVRSPNEADEVVNCTALVEWMQERLRRMGENVVDVGSGAMGGLGGHGGSGGIGGGGGGLSLSMGGGGGGGGGSSRDLLHHHHKDGGGGGVTLQPVFDVRVVDGKHYSKENRNYKYMDTQKIVRRVSKWITSSFSGRGEDALIVLSVDLPFGLMRELSSQLMERGAAGVDVVAANYPRYRKQVRYTADEILALDPSAGGRVGRERYILLHSLVDDRYDMMSLVHSSKSSSSGGGGGGGASGGGGRKGDRDYKNMSRRTP